MKLALTTIILALLVGSTLFFSSETRADWTYTVKRGDTLFSVARRTGITVNDLKKRNGLRSYNLRLGQRLIIPTGRTSGATPRGGSGDVALLASLIHAEAGAEPYLGKVAVGGVVLNRVQDSKFPKSVAGVVYQPHAFESVSNGIINRTPSQESRKAAVDAISGWDPSGGALYFFNPSKPVNPWIWARRIINRIGNHVFAL